MTYKTQSFDTSIEAELIQFELWRRLSKEKKLELVKKAARKVNRLVLMSVESEYINEAREIYIRKRLGNEFVEILSQGYRDKLMLEDSIWLANKIGSILDRLKIPYYVGGSVASSLQGEIRYTQDVDLVINIKSEQIQLLFEAFREEFYISEVAVAEAVKGNSCFNVIHLETTEKADIFVSGEDAFSVAKMSRRRLYCQDISEGKFYICTAEDTILQKLIWFNLMANESQKQWRDIQGVLKLQREKLDFAYLRQWGESLGVWENLEKAFTEAGI